MKDWIRVTRQHRCKVCGKEDWCLISPDGAVALCMRVQNDHPKEFVDGNLGWVHRLNGDVRPPPKPKPIEFTENPTRKFTQWNQLPRERLGIFAGSLGLTRQALEAMQCVPTDWPNAWGFPMKTPTGTIIGIRIRAEDGGKWSLRGGHEGFFMPVMEPQKRLYVTEGPTDCAAAVSLGFYAIGRPNCAPRSDQVSELVQVNRIKEVVIVADMDEAGFQGATKLSENLTVRNCILVLPEKDFRAFTNAGGTAEMINSMVDHLIWRNGVDSG